MVVIYVVVQIFPWFKIFQTSLIFTFLCLKSITIIRDKEKQKLNSFEKFQTKEKFKPQHIHAVYNNIIFLKFSPFIR